MFKRTTSIITLFLCALTFLCIDSSGQALNGPYTVAASGGNYTSLAAAVSALNTNGISGNVIIKVPAGWKESAPSGGYSLTATGTASNHITIQKNGAGANPLLTAYTGGTATVSSNAALDGIFRFLGSDYVTIDGIDVQDSSANNTNATWMEFGYGFFKVNGTNGCQYNTIKNCKITLNRANFIGATPIQVAAGCMGILLDNATNTSPNTAVTVTNATGENAYNVFLNNTITNVFEGIWIKGYNSTTYYDQGNIIGRIGKGNNISNFGSGAGALATYGIYMYAQNTDSIAGDTINNTANGGAAHTNTLYGIYQSNSNSTAYVYSNNINLTQGNNASAFYGIDLAITGTSNIYTNNNKISQTITSGASGVCYGIYLPTAATCNLYINTDTFSVSTTGAVSGVYSSIYSSAFCNSLNINSNVLLSSAVNTTQSAYFIFNTGANTGITCTYNKVLGLNKTGSPGSIYGYYNTTGTAAIGTEAITNNNFSNLTATGSTAVYGIYTNTLDAQVKNISYDTISGCSSGTGIMAAIDADYLGTGSTINNNYITNNTGAGTTLANSVYGIYSLNGSSGEGLVSITNNYISNINSTAVSGSTYCIYNANTKATNVRIVKNTISNIAPTGATSPTNYGIYGATGANYAIDSNTISNFSVPSAATTSTNYGIFCLGSATTANIIENSISGFSGHGSTNKNYGIYVQSNTAGGTSMVYGNNISGFSAAATTNSNYGINIVNGLASTTTNIDSNTIKTFTGSGTTTTNYGVAGAAGGSLSSTNIYKNKITSFTGTSTNVVNYGVNMTGGVAGSLATNIYNDTIYALTGAGTGNSYGIYTTSATGGGSATYIYNDTISNLTAPTSCYGIDIINSNINPVKIYNNRINTLTTTGTTTNNSQYGISYYCGAGNSYVYKNIISGISGFSSNANTNTAIAIYANTFTASANDSIYNNTIKTISSTTTTGAGSNYGIQVAAGATSANTAVYGNQISSFTGTGATINNYGISATAGASSSSTSLYKNKISSLSGTATNVNCYGINMAGGASGSNVSNIYGDTVLNLTASGSGTAFGIYNVSATAGGSPTNIYNDTLANLTGIATCYGIYQFTGNSTATQVYNNRIYNLNCAGTTGNNLEAGIYMASLALGNNIYSNVINSVTGTASGANANTAYGIYTVAAPSIYSLGIYSNTIKTITSNTSSNTGTTYGVYTAAGLSSSNTNIYSNNISTLSGSGTTTNNYGINATAGAASSTTSIYKNKISSISGTATTVNGYGVYLTGGAASCSPTNIYSNNINSISCNGVSDGIFTGSSTASGPVTNIYNDTISNLSSATITSGIIQASATVNNTNIYNNNIYNLTATSNSSNTYGINLGSGATIAVYNNFISDLRASTSNNTNAVSGIYANGGTTVNAYYNSIYLNASGTGTNFGSSALSFATTILLDLRNNILSNSSSYNGAGNTAALLRMGTTTAGTPPLTTNYASTSGNNLFYVPTTAGNYFSYIDQATTASALNKFTNGCGGTGFIGFKKFISSNYTNGRDTLSVFELPPFVNTSSTPYDLHLSTSTGTRAESGGINVSGITADIDGNTRQGNGGYSGTGSSPDVGASEFNGSNKTGSSIQWVGAVSTNWNNTANWCPYIPNSSDNVTVSTGYTYAPVIYTTGTCNNLTINGSTTATVNSGGTLNLYGNLSNSGTFTATSGTLALNGTTAQSIPPVSVKNLTLNNTNANGVTVTSGTLTVSNTLTLTTGKITVDTLSVTNNATNAVTGYQTDPTSGPYSTSSYVNGSLKRAVLGSGQYDFPVGSSAQYEMMSLVLNSLVGTSTLKAQFSTTNGGCTSPNPDSLNVGGTKIQTLLDGGHWLVTPSAEPTSGTYSAYLNERGYSAFPGDPAQMTIIKRSSCASIWKAPGSHSNATQYFSNNTAHLEQTGFTSFSDFGAGWGDFALPVRLLSFDAVADNSYTVHTTWMVATQENNNQFNVQRSADGLHFTTIGSIKGCGNCDKVLEYSFDDKQALTGLSYYRLQMVDIAGTNTYSNIKEVNFNNSTVAQMTLSPNPNNGNFSLDIVKTGSVSNAHIQVLNMYGQIVDEQTVSLNSNGSHILYTNKDLNTGIYFVKVIVGSQTLVTKVSIQK